MLPCGISLLYVGFGGIYFIGKVDWFFFLVLIYNFIRLLYFNDFPTSRNFLLTYYVQSSTIFFTVLEF